MEIEIFLKMSQSFDIYVIATIAQVLGTPKCFKGYWYFTHEIEFPMEPMDEVQLWKRWMEYEGKDIKDLLNDPFLYAFISEQVELRTYRIR